MKNKVKDSGDERSATGGSPETKYPKNFIRFLGTAGTRFVMLSQRRATGGIWFSYGGCLGVIDPGPGSLVRICEAVPPLSPIDINTLILTHRHIDHSSDLNVLAEGMTLNSAERRGCVLLTEDSSADGDSVLLKFAEKKIERVCRHGDGRITALPGGVTAESVRHEHHGVQCYGVVFRKEGLPTWGLLSDTSALPSFPERYSECDILVMNVTMLLPRSRLDHLSMPDAVSLLEVIHPKLAIVTHMSSMLLDYGPERIAKALSTERTKAVAASDGLVVNLEGPL
ncbi:MAG: MBL fold metallo-hydrolase [Synergistaceae bacterium]|nr:MBL fold metallo-hydrolase [Synergistaceae bacterium]